MSGVEVQSLTEPAPSLPDDVRGDVVATLDGYLNTAMVTPLRSGGIAGDLTPLFTPEAGARAAGPDQATMVDEGLPPADVQVVVSTARLGALAGSEGSIAVVAATVDVRLQTTGRDPVTIVRTGDLVLVPEGDGWKIDGYDLSTARNSGTGTTTTTARR